jgi:hypothetical protein
VGACYSLIDTERRTSCICQTQGARIQEWSATQCKIERFASERTAW